MDKPQDDRNRVSNAPSNAFTQKFTTQETKRYPQSTMEKMEQYVKIYAQQEDFEIHETDKENE